MVILVGLGWHTINQRDQRARIALLGAHLGKFRIEKLMHDLIQGYLRALGESDLQRQSSIWSMLSTTETDLCEQFDASVLDFLRLPGGQARASQNQNRDEEALFAHVLLFF